VRVLMIGAPGAGKGTQGVRVAEHYGITHISSGDLLREHVRDGSAIGVEAQRFVGRGDLVPDTLVLEMLREPIVAASASGGYVLDGFPRTVQQAEAAHRLTAELGVEVQAAVHLDVSRDELVRRLLARGRGTDDTREVIEHRLAVYDEKTLPMLQFYAGRAALVRVDGDQPVEAVTAELLERLEELREAAV